MKTTRNSWVLPLSIAGLTMLILGGTVSVFRAEAQTPRRIVAVYQFNSTIPNISGPMVRDLFIGSLVRSGQFGIVQQSAAGAEFIFDGALSEGKAVKGNMKSVLKDLLAGDQGSLSFDVRVVEARSGMLLDYINVTATDVSSKKLKLADFLRGMGSNNQAGQNSATAEFLNPYITEAVNRIAAKYGPPGGTASGFFPSQPGGFAQPGSPNPSDPYQSGYPSNPQSTPGYTQPGYPSAQYPSSPGYQVPGGGYPSQPVYPSSQYPTQPPSAQSYPQQGYPSTQYPSQPPPGQSYPQTAYPSTQYPSSQYPSTDPNQSGYPYSTQPGYPSTQNPYGTPGAPGSTQQGYPTAQYPQGTAGAPGSTQQGYPTTQYPQGTAGAPGSAQQGYPTTQYPPGTQYPSQPQTSGGSAPAQVQPRGIDDSAAGGIAGNLLAKFDPAQHEVADTRANSEKQLREGSNLIHTDASGHRLFAIVEGGQIVEWAATDAQSNPVPLILMGNESSCWECAMSPGLCWKVSCALEEKEPASTTPK
jgi:hypothetical protein